MPSPEDKIRDEYKKINLCEKVEQFIEMCESFNDSKYHYDYLKSLYNKLSKKYNVIKLNT